MWCRTSAGLAIGAVAAGLWWPAAHAQSVPSFNKPSGIAIGGSGNIFVANFGSGAVLKLSPSGALLGQFGGQGSGPGQLAEPNDVALDSVGDVYVADYGNNRIEKFSSGGKLIASWERSLGPDWRFKDPTGVTVDRSGNVWVSDYGNRYIEKFSPTGKFLDAWNYPGYKVAIDKRGHVYDLDGDGAKVLKFGPRMGFQRQWGVYTEGFGEKTAPLNIAVDGHGNVWVANTSYNAVQKFSPTGKEIGRLGVMQTVVGHAPGHFDNPDGIAFDTQGDVYVSEAAGNRLQKLSPTGKVLAVWGG